MVYDIFLCKTMNPTAQFTRHDLYIHSLDLGRSQVGAISRIERLQNRQQDLLFEER